MGDAGKRDCSKKGWLSSVKFVQGLKQKDYLLWKYMELESIAIKNSLKENTSFDKRYNSINKKWIFYTSANTDVEDIQKQFYGEDSVEKEITMEILKNLTPLSIAVWMMDDGVTAWSHSTIKRTGWNITPTHGFCTDSFSLESCENIKRWFPESYNIKCRIKSRGLCKDGITMKYRVLIEHESNEDFIALIEPHMLPLFNYKINYQEYLKWRKEND